VYALKVKCAVIGSGIAGLTAAWLLSKKHEVTLFEKQDDIGMGYFGVPVGEELVDTPMRVFNPKLWREFSAFIEHLDLPSHPVDVACSFSNVEGSPYFRYENIAQQQKLWPIGVHGKFLAKHFETLMGVIKLRKPANPQHTLGEHLNAQGFNDAFVRGYLLPMLGTICTCSNEALLRYPAQVIVEELKRILVPTGLRRVDGGTRAFVKKIRGQLGTLHLGRPIVAVLEDGEGPSVQTSEARWRFDHVVIATQANHAATLLGPGFEKEKAVLGRFKYEENEIVVHKDRRFLPKDMSMVSPLNFVLSKDKNASMSTVLVNAIDDWKNGSPVLQTWNPLFPPRSEDVFFSIKMERPVVTFDSQHALQALQAYSKQPRLVHFVGSYAHEGIPLLETGVRSSLALAKYFGVKAPWTTGYA